MIESLEAPQQLRQLPFRLSIIGCGQFVQNIHLPAICLEISTGRLLVDSIWSNNSSMSAIGVANALTSLGHPSPIVMTGPDALSTILARPSSDCVLIAVPI